MRWLLLLFCCITISTLTAQNIYTVAGNGVAGFGGDDSSAIHAPLNLPFGIAIDSVGNVYIADKANNRVRKINEAGIITTIAGNGIGGYSGDGGWATAASIYDITGVAVDKYGSVYIADKSNQRIRKVDTIGIITTIAGTGIASYNGDNIIATTAQLNNPRGVAIDTKGNVYIADQANERIRKIDTQGIITTVIGNGTIGFSGDNGQATLAQLNNPYSLAIDRIGNIYVCDVDNQRIRKIDTTGIITSVAGNGTGGYSGDNEIATTAALNEPIGVATDTNGNIYIADGWNNRIRLVNNMGIINTIVGTGASGFAGDGNPAILATLYLPYGIAISKTGSIYIADNGNNRIRKTAIPTLIKNTIYKQELQIFPNPNNGSFTILISSTTKAEAFLSITNLLGQIILQTTLPTNTPTQIILKAPIGLYDLKVRCEGEIINSKVWIAGR